MKYIKILALLVLAGCGLSDEELRVMSDRNQDMYGKSERWKNLDDYLIKQALPKLDESSGS